MEGPKKLLGMMFLLPRVEDKHRLGVGTPRKIVCDPQKVHMPFFIMFIRCLTPREARAVSSSEETPCYSGSSAGCTEPSSRRGNSIDYILTDQARDGMG